MEKRKSCVAHIHLNRIDTVTANHAEIDHSGALPELMRHIAAMCMTRR
jgi:flavorubredoxin